MTQTRFDEINRHTLQPHGIQKIIWGEKTVMIKEKKNVNRMVLLVNSIQLRRKIQKKHSLKFKRVEHKSI